VLRRVKVSSTALKQKGIHTWLGMLGYCSKDEGQPHYKCWKKNVSDAVR
jgi:hypothetical protein